MRVIGYESKSSWHVENQSTSGVLEKALFMQSLQRGVFSLILDTRVHISFDLDKDKIEPFRALYVVHAFHVV